MPLQHSRVQMWWLRVWIVFWGMLRLPASLGHVHASTNSQRLAICICYAQWDTVCVNVTQLHPHRVHHTQRHPLNDSNRHQPTCRRS